MYYKYLLLNPLETMCLSGLYIKNTTLINLKDQK